MGAPTLIDDNIDLHTGVDGFLSVGAISPGEVAFGVVSFIGGVNDNVVLSAQESPWAVMDVLDDAFGDTRWYFLRGIATALWSPSLDTTGSTSDFGSAAGYEGGLYIVTLVPGEGTLHSAAVGDLPTPPPDFRTAPHTAEAHAVALHGWSDTSISATVTWDAAAGGEGATRLAGQQLSDATNVIAVEAYTYSTAGAKSALGGNASGYGSNVSPVTGWMGFTEDVVYNRGGHWG